MAISVTVSFIRPRGLDPEVAGVRTRENVLLTKGTGAAYTTDTAGYAIGAVAITLITGTGTVLAGDLVTFAGDANKYLVSVGVAAPGVITLASPGLLVAIAAASAVAMTIGAAGTTTNAAVDGESVYIVNGTSSTVAVATGSVPDAATALATAASSAGFGLAASASMIIPAYTGDKVNVKTIS